MTRDPALAVRLLIVGPQGSGKGTQGARIAEAFDVPVVSTGDVFRWNVANATELGLEVQTIIDAGELVPDALTSRIVRDRLAQPDADGGYLLDGYPRNQGQVDDLDEFLRTRGHDLDAVIQLDVPREESVARIALRAAEQGRADDTVDVIAHRLDIYERQTAPLLEVYRARGIVDAVDGCGSLDEVFARVMGALEARGLVPVPVA